MVVGLYLMFLICFFVCCFFEVFLAYLTLGCWCYFVCFAVWGCLVFGVCSSILLVWIVLLRSLLCGLVLLFCCFRIDFGLVFVLWFCLHSLFWVWFC